MTPEQCIADLDASLAEDGTEVKLQRLTLGPGGLQIPFSVDCMAFVRRKDQAAPAIANGVVQEWDQIILSPTEINAKNWPGPNSSATPTDIDRRVPSSNLKDRFIIEGRPRTVASSIGIYMQGVLVRIECRVLG